jgi:hypothetical protein
MAALDIVGVFEASEILGLKPASFSHLRARSRGVEGSNFPPPAAELRMGPVWHRKDIVNFAKKYRAVSTAKNTKAAKASAPEPEAPPTTARQAKKIVAKGLVKAK